MLYDMSNRTFKYFKEKSVKTAFVLELNKLEEKNFKTTDEIKKANEELLKSGTEKANFLLKDNILEYTNYNKEELTRFLVRESDDLKIEEDKLRSLKSYNLSYKDMINILDENIEKENLEDEMVKNSKVYTKVNKETINDMNKDIKFHTLFDTFSDKKSNLGNLMEHFDYIYQNRIENMEGEEKISLVERSSEFLGLKLNSNGKVQEFLNENENDYMDKINEVLEINKWNLYIEIKRDIEVSKENLKSNKTEINDTNIFNSLKRKYREEVKTDTLTLQEEFIENAIPILLKKDNMGLSRQEIENFYDEVPQETKNKLFERIDNYFKESSDTLKGFNNKKVFENQSYYFLYNDYDELHKIELPKEKSVKKEIKKEKNIELEKEMDM